MQRSEHEDRLLGALLNDSTLLDAGRVSATLFQGKDAREVYATMAGLRNAGRPVNRDTLLLEIGERVPATYLSDVLRHHGIGSDWRNTTSSAWLRRHRGGSCTGCLLDWCKPWKRGRLPRRSLKASRRSSP